MTSTANLAATAGAADHPAVPAAEAGPFVLNLCSSTTPMALAQTDLPELKRFTFFVSRRFEEGRERFRLHMGFFASQAEAEEWLGVVRDIYPGAWAGEAPGKKLRARAAEAAATQARHAVGPQGSAQGSHGSVTAPKAAVVATPSVPSVARPQSTQPPAPARIPTLVPTLHPPAAAPASAARRPAPAQVKGAPQPVAKRPQAAAPALRAAAPTAARAPAQSPRAPRPMPAARPAAASALTPQSRTGSAPAAGQRPILKAPAAKPSVPPAQAAPSRPSAPAVSAAAKSTPMAPKPTLPAVKAAPPAAARVPQPQQSAKKPIFADSNVKEVLAALDSSSGEFTGETRLMPSPLGRSDNAEEAALTDTQVLRFLEARREEDDSARAQSALQVDAAAESGISLLKPDDTGTRRALKEAVSHNEPVAFAVQLQWSVQPVELDKVPPLAIFSAYTLYSVEGSREGRKWYGLRLGFFNDAISAKQVAYYVRSEFTSVAVVPVSPQERERATEDSQRFAATGAPRKRLADDDNEFKLIDSDAAAAPPAAPAGKAPGPDVVSGRPPLERGSPAPAAVAAPPPQPAASPSQPAAPARAARKSGNKVESGGKVEARERRTPQTLEETLEILGANELAIDNGRRDTLSDTGVRHLRVEFQKNTPFSRLLERLSERVRKA